VTWSTPGNDENDSMPIWNGDLVANVWTEQNGDLVLLIAKSDAWSEIGKLLMLARMCIHIAQPSVAAVQFVQTLHLEEGSVEIRSGRSTIQVWVDANRPVIHIQAPLCLTRSSLTPNWNSGARRPAPITSPLRTRVAR